MFFRRFLVFVLNDRWNFHQNYSVLLCFRFHDPFCLSIFALEVFLGLRQDDGGGGDDVVDAGSA
jgi:hypothetical protein